MAKAEYVILRAQGVVYQDGQWNPEAAELASEISKRVNRLGYVSVGETIDVSSGEILKNLYMRSGDDIDRREGPEFVEDTNDSDCMGTVYRNMIEGRWETKPERTIVVEANAAGAIGAKNIKCAEVLVLLGTNQSADGFPKGVTIVKNGLMPGVYDQLMKKLQG